jgi:hypothetical protein
MLFELLGFLLSTNAKVKKMTTVSAVMVEIVEMYIFQIHLHYFFLACCMLKQKNIPAMVEKLKKRRIGKKNTPFINQSENSILI